jgi:hypothetical protein
MLGKRKIEAFLLMLILVLAFSMPPALPATADSGGVLLIGLGVHVEPFGAVPANWQEAALNSQGRKG